ncbi:unnamed protein product [Vitrella brassicaformis CCMP3155]|uniref:Trimethylguanosine synthase n=1 Tax=Vitrella brassicaformis (strain CCMP3155) TaxID=1169540 RepID=A0A0G4FPI7_VITBC|nr:unnamed protein product [Vitrella brassicaformis CCMP3155]|eukprot:CEM15748.1 unnamed protein product [Vitrella brassicaformis CCMP3155]
MDTLRWMWQQIAGRRQLQAPADAHTLDTQEGDVVYVRPTYLSWMDELVLFLVPPQETQRVLQVDATLLVPPHKADPPRTPPAPDAGMPHTHTPAGSEPCVALPSPSCHGEDHLTRRGVRRWRRLSAACVVLQAAGDGQGCEGVYVGEWVGGRGGGVAKYEGEWANQTTERWSSTPRPHHRRARTAGGGAGVGVGVGVAADDHGEHRPVRQHDHIGPDGHNETGKGRESDQVAATQPPGDAPVDRATTASPVRPMSRAVDRLKVEVILTVKVVDDAALFHNPTAMSNISNQKELMYSVTEEAIANLTAQAVAKVYPEGLIFEPCVGAALARQGLEVYGCEVNPVHYAIAEANLYKAYGTVFADFPWGPHYNSHSHHFNLSTMGPDGRWIAYERMAAMCDLSDSFVFKSPRQASLGDLDGRHDPPPSEVHPQAHHHHRH